MLHQDQALELIERALDTRPHCPACGAPTTISEAADAGLWLVCSAADQADGLLARMSAALFPHVRTLVVDPELAAAA
jgi:hypothetical protein